eukprot:933134-Rhodomonas_salina.3
MSLRASYDKGCVLGTDVGYSATRELAMGRRGAEKIAKQFNRYLMQASTALRARYAMSGTANRGALGDAHQMFETLHEVSQPAASTGIPCSEMWCHAM